MSASDIYGPPVKRFAFLREETFFCQSQPVAQLSSLLPCSPLLREERLREYTPKEKQPAALRYLLVEERLRETTPTEKHAAALWYASWSRKG